MEATEVLHTLSDKADIRGAIITFQVQSKQIDLVNKSMDYLQSREAELYKWLNASNYTDFMNKIRKWFEVAGHDAKILENFRKANLNNILFKSTTKYPTEAMNQKVTIECIAPAGIDIGKLIAKGIEVQTSNIQVSADSKNLILSFEYNPQNIKTVLNTIDNRKFRTGTKGMDEANKAITNLIDAERIGSFVINKKTKNKEIIQKLGTDKNNPFAFTSGSIEDAIRYAKEYNDKTLLTLLEKARQEIYQILSELCSGGSSPLRMAFEKTWGEKIGFTNIENLTFFLKGRNIKSGVGGAIQEFLAAMLTNYLTFMLTTYHIQRKQIVEILGNIAFQHGEQPKTDVQILNRIGIQVKAYNQQNLKYRTMKTNIHPSGLDDGLLGYSLNIGDAIVQSCFNTSNDYDMNYFSELIRESALAQAMSFTTNEISTIEQTVCFYFLDGKYLVPGSVILSRLQVVNPEVSIRTPGSIGNDPYFKSKEPGFTTSYVDNRTGKHRQHTVANFVQFWEGRPLEPSDENLSEYDQLYYKRISIDVKFDYSFMYDSTYAIYN